MGGGSLTNLRRAIDGEFRTLFNLRRYWRRILGGYLVWSAIVTFGGQQKPLFSHKLPDGSWLLVDHVSFWDASLLLRSARDSLPFATVSDDLSTAGQV